MLIAGVDKYVVHMIPKGPCHIYIYIYQLLLSTLMVLFVPQESAEVEDSHQELTEVSAEAADLDQAEAVDPEVPGGDVDGFHCLNL